LLGILIFDYSTTKGNPLMYSIKKRTHGKSRPLLAALAAVTLFVGPILADGPTEKSIQGPNGVDVSVKMIGPVTQTADLQIICVLQHEPAGDKYIEAMKDFNDKLGGLLSSIRDRGEFAGEPGETFLFNPPANSIAPKQVLLIGVGEEKLLTLDRLKLVGRIAAREAVRLNAVHVSFAPTLRDQGSNRIDVGDGDAAVTEAFLLAYDTETKLQAQSLSTKASITDFTIEAGPKFFDGALKKVTDAVSVAATELSERKNVPYVSLQIK
jgi:hypothetical protein